MILSSAQHDAAYDDAILNRYECLEGVAHHLFNNNNKFSDNLIDFYSPSSSGVAVYCRFTDLRHTVRSNVSRFHQVRPEEFSMRPLTGATAVDHE